MEFQRINPNKNLYIVVEESSLESLMRRVNFEIDKGYETVGGVSFCFSQYVNSSYIQAMVLKPLPIKNKEA